jgi:hypothetical protein
MYLLPANLSRLLMLCSTLTFIGTASCFDRYRSMRTFKALSTRGTYMVVTGSQMMMLQLVCTILHLICTSELGATSIAA